MEGAPAVSIAHLEYVEPAVVPEVLFLDDPDADGGEMPCIVVSAARLAGVEPGPVVEHP